MSSSSTVSTECPEFGDSDEELFYDSDDNDEVFYDSEPEVFEDSPAEGDTFYDSDDELLEARNSKAKRSYSARRSGHFSFSRTNGVLEGLPKTLGSWGFHFDET